MSDTTLVVAVLDGHAHVFRANGDGRVDQVAQIAQLRPDLTPAQTAALAVELSRLLSGTMAIEVRGNGRPALHAIEVPPAGGPLTVKTKNARKRAAPGRAPRRVDVAEVRDWVALLGVDARFTTAQLHAAFEGASRIDVSNRLSQLNQTEQVAHTEVRGEYVVKARLYEARDEAVATAAPAGAPRSEAEAKATSDEVLEWARDKATRIFNNQAVKDAFPALTTQDVVNRLTYLWHRKDLRRIGNGSYTLQGRSEGRSTKAEASRPSSSEVYRWLLSHKPNEAFTTHTLRQAFPGTSRKLAENRIVYLLGKRQAERLAPGMYRLTEVPAQEVAEA